MSVINTNIGALNAQRNLMSSSKGLQTSLQRLSSGLRINSAKDDAAGLAIASRMSAQIGGLNQAIRNANDGISLAQTAEGALGTSSSMLLRMRDLAVQAANDTNSGTDRSALQQEVAQLQQEINRVANTTEFNGKKLLDGTFTAQLFQVGANANQTVAVSMSSAKSTAIGNNALQSKALVPYAAAANASAGNAIAAQTLTIAGNVGTTTATVALNDSAKTIADSVNLVSAQTGVTATASTSATLDTLSVAGTYTFSLFGSNTSTAVTFSAQVTNTNDLSSVADAINGKSAQTGITAVANGSSVTITNDQGYDIAIQDFANAAGSASTINFSSGGTSRSLSGATASATDSARVAGRVSFSSSLGYSVASNDAGNTLMTAQANASTLSAVSAIDVGSQSGANAAIAVVDGALGFINGLRAQLGAVQNRIESTVANLSATSENLSAARSRVQDADFAKETAELTRSQVLQQAGMAMLAQANAVPSQVLTLLRG